MKSGQRIEGAKWPPGRSEFEVHHSCGDGVNRRVRWYSRRPYEIGGGSSGRASGPEVVDWTAAAGRQLRAEVGVSRREGARRRGISRGAGAGTPGGVGRDAREEPRDWAGAPPVCEYARRVGDSFFCGADCGGGDYAEGV